MSGLDGFDVTTPGDGYQRAPHWDAEQIMREAAEDMFPGDDPRQARYMADLITNEMWRRKTPDGIRNALTRYWSVVQHLKLIAPDQFDRVLLEFAERASLFPECADEIGGNSEN